MTSKITPRRFRASFPADVPRYWANGSPFLTAILNTYTILVPDNELYYIRTLRKTLGRIRDPELKQDLLAFFRQEGEHGLAHRSYWDNLQAQGFRTRGFTRTVNFILYRLIEPILPLRAHVAIVAAIEHINAMLAHEFLSGNLLRDSDARLKRLFECHFAEEIEHKSVSMDTLHAMRISWPLRALVMLFVAPSLYLTFLLGTLMLLAQDRQLLRWRTARDAWTHLISRDRMLFRTVLFLARYMRPGFDPSDLKDDDLGNAVVLSYFPEAATGPRNPGTSPENKPDSQTPA